MLVVNNTTDQTAEIVRALRLEMGFLLELIEHDFPPERACAGSARRMAMERAAAVAGTGGFLLTTDADGRVPTNWIESNLNYLRHGLDAVAGRAVLEPADYARIPLRLREDDAIECAYAAALDEMASLVKPQAWDPWPRHSEHSGASIAVTVEAYKKVGGMPDAPIAEDRHFFAALLEAGLRVRHAPEIAVTVSGRTIGRAEGGMADTIRRRLERSDPYLDSALEPARDFWSRLQGDVPARKRLVASSDAVTELALARQIIIETKTKCIFGERQI